MPTHADYGRLSNFQATFFFGHYAYDMFTQQPKIIKHLICSMSQEMQVLGLIILACFTFLASQSAFEN